jgi:hypothetical protein
MIAWPAQQARDIDALTTSVDLFATLAELFAVPVRQRTHGKSVIPLIEGSATSIRDWLLMGVWGREVHVTDGAWKYARAPKADNGPLAMLSNRWSTMPTHILTREQELPLPDHRAVLGRMPGSTVPVIRQTWDASDAIPFWARAKFTGNHLFDVATDPTEENNRTGEAGEKRYADLLRHALEEVEAPPEQFERLGLS